MDRNIQSRLEIRNVNVGGHRTSLRLEADVWAALEEICMRENLTVHEVCTLVERRRKGSSRTAAVRVFILGYFRAAASDKGHLRAGHGDLTPGSLRSKLKDSSDTASSPDMRSSPGVESCVGP